MRKSTSSTAGFSLIELVIAMVIFVIVTGAIYQLLAVGRSDRFTANQKIDALQNVRAAMNYVGRDTLNAGVGYYPQGPRSPDDFLAVFGLEADADTTWDAVTPIIPGDDVDANGLNPVEGTLTDRITLISSDETFNNGLSLSIMNLSSNGQLVTIDTRGPDGAAGTEDDVSNALCDPNEIYVLTTSLGQALGWMSARASTNQLAFSTGLSADPMSLNLGVGSTTHTLASIRPAAPTGLSVIGSITKLDWTTYFIDSDGTMIRRVYGDPATNRGTGVPESEELRWLDEPMAFGIEDFQIEYVLKDGTVTSNPTVAQCRDVRQIRVTTTARSGEVNPRTREPLRTTISNIFSTRNLAYRVR